MELGYVIDVLLGRPDKENYHMSLIQIDPSIKGHVGVFIDELDKVMDRCSVHVALDIGSRDAMVAIALEEYFPEATIYAFECNPPAIADCERNLSDHPDITLVTKAVSDENGPVNFYAIDPERTITTWPDGNIAASSLYVANPAYPLETYFQNKITVEAITLEQWAVDAGVNTVDIIWMDLQGAELKALRGMGGLIDTVKIIYTEVEYKEMYLGQPLSGEVNEWLTSRGFHFHTKMNTSAWFGDELYVRDGLG
jgi:FkbM family methyltransferase